MAAPASVRVRGDLRAARLAEMLDECGEGLDQLARVAAAQRSRRGVMRVRALSLREQVDVVASMVEDLERERAECGAFFDDRGYFAVCRLPRGHRAASHAASSAGARAADRVRSVMEAHAQLGALLSALLVQTCAGVGDLDRVAADTVALRRSLRRLGRKVDESLSEHPPPVMSDRPVGAMPRPGRIRRPGSA